MPEANELIGGRYRLGPAIGSGGMGTVRRARDVRFDRDVAVKLLRTAADPRHQERMRREARLLGALQHPNLVAAYDTGIDLTPDGPLLWLAMELVRGPDLGVLLAHRGRLASEDVRRIVHDAAAAIAALHAAGVVHRDLKPANLLLTREPGPGPWHVKVADLGIALTEDATAMTTTGQVMGTAAYLSPEQVSGAAVDAASDVYSLGLLALVALAGKHPFPGGAVESATARLVRAPELPRWITGGWRMLLEAMTAIDPALRPTAEQVVAATAAPLPALVPAGPVPEVADPDPDGRTVAAEALLPTAVLPAVGARIPVEPVPSGRPGLLPLAAAIAVVLGLAGGGAALLGAAAGAPSPARHTTSAGPTTVAVTHTPEPAHSVTAKPTATQNATPVPAREVVAPKKASPGKGRGSQKGSGRGRGHDKG
ncbi:serine/threonine-protein kinase [Amnibacterium sp.]|uniref:serine/threonine-protein kinase n=1 Tax=Amnibacterium sp. TaxID=1872496 RepID=UPI0026341E96|nr:serine/threonine-protein kinase [Amnibacterium sp.]MCU1473426.1 Serine/threonine-protein kinase StkP [Amnibacterium sp.]